MMKRSHLITALALLFFLGPLGLRAVGVTARPFENRPMAPPPSLHAGWDVFDQTTRFFTDRMPLREQAVRAQTWAARNVLVVPPAWRRDLLADQANSAALPQDKQLEPERLVEGRAAGTLLGSTAVSTTPERVVRRAVGAPKLSGTTLFLSDSYGLYDGPLLVPYARELVQVPWPGTAPDAIVAAVEAADRVIIQIVERELNIQLADGGPFGALLAAAQAGLTPRSKP